MGMAGRSAMITVSYESDSGFTNDIGGIGGGTFNKLLLSLRLLPSKVNCFNVFSMITIGYVII